jgi:RNA polymerase sigma factor (sigma-70 family)
MFEGQQEFTVLMRSIEEGSEDAVRALLDRYQTPLLKAVRSRLPPRLRPQYDSDDFVQAVWASFFTGPAVRRFETPEALVAYLAEMARNKVIDEIRRQLRGRHNLREPQSLDTVDPSYSTPDVAARQPTPSHAVSTRERWQKLRDRLAATEQRILDLLLEGNTQEEIAHQLGLSDRHVRRVLRKIAEGPVP